MPINIGANFTYKGKLPNFERDSFTTKQEMHDFPETSIDDGHLSYCKADGNTYQFKSSNSVDDVTGKWRIFKTDVDVDAVLNGTSTNAIQNKAVFDALKLKADTSSIDSLYDKLNKMANAKQDKSGADYTLTGNTVFSNVTKDAKSIDLNGYTLTFDISCEGGELEYNGTYKNIKRFYNGIVNFDNTRVAIKWVLFHDCVLKGNGYSILDTCTIYNCVIEGGESITSSDGNISERLITNCQISNCILRRDKTFNKPGYAFIQKSNLWYVSILGGQIDDFKIYAGGGNIYSCCESLYIDYSADYYLLNESCDINFIQSKNCYANIKTTDISYELDVFNSILINVTHDGTSVISGHALIMNSYVNIAGSGNSGGVGNVSIELINSFFLTDESNDAIFLHAQATAVPAQGSGTMGEDYRWEIKTFYESNLDNPNFEYNAPSCEAVRNKLTNYLTKTELGSSLDSYLTKTDANTTYATKEKAFTKDTASTEPGQVVAGPATTQGNLYLRKLIADDIPDLKNKYQAITTSGYQVSPKILNATVRNNNGDAKSFIKASISEASSGKNSPDWYYATDGSLQDITASYYDKIYLDDKFKVISASLNDLASKAYDDTEVRQLISNNTSAIGTKADKSELSRYQPKYDADYVASSNLASLPITTGIIDLNGYTLTISSQPTEFPSSIINGAINVSAQDLSLNSVILKNVQITSDIGSTLSASHDVEFIDCEIDEVSVAEGAEVTFRNTNVETCNASSGIPLIFDSTFTTISCGEGGTLNCNIYDSTIATLNATAIQDNCGFNNTEIGGTFYKRGIAKNNKIVEDGYESDIDNPTIQGNAPSCDAVKTKLANYVPKTSTSNIDIIAPGVTIGPDATSKAVKVSSNLVQFNIDGNMISLSQANGINFQTAVGKKVTIGGREVATMDVINAMPKTVFITQAAYDALTTKDANTIYYING